MKTATAGPSEETARIVIAPGRRSGRLVVRGTRVAVADILSMLSAGMSVDEVRAEFPVLERADIVAALAHAAALAGVPQDVA